MKVKEYWRPIIGFEGYYEVSNLGRVRSLDRVVDIPSITRNGQVRHEVRRYKERILKYVYPGYVPYVHIHSAEHKKNAVAVKKLVVDSFFGVNSNLKDLIVHDGNEDNCTFSNILIVGGTKLLVEDSLNRRINEISSQLSKQSVKTLRGQIESGDYFGADKGIYVLIHRLNIFPDMRV